VKSEQPVSAMSSEDKREVIRLINEWNSSRYELFALSQPNEVELKKKLILNDVLRDENIL
jgi:hypothetical protein